MNKGEKFVKKLLEEAGHRTEAELAAAAGLHYSTFAHFRAGRREVGASVILAIHEKLGIPVATIRQWLASSEAEAEGEQ